MLMGVRQRIGHVAHDANRIRHRQLAFTRKSLSQRLAGDVWHDVIKSRAFGAHGAGIEQWHDMRMPEARRDADFLKEAFAPDGSRQIRA